MDNLNINSAMKGEYGFLLDNKSNRSNNKNSNNKSINSSINKSNNSISSNKK